MKNIKTLIASTLTATLLLATLAGCSPVKANSDGKTLVNAPQSTLKATSETSATDESSKQYKVGVSQLMEHPSLDEARKGFIDGLAENGYKDNENIKIDYQNAQGDMSNCQTIAQKLINDKNDIILAIATPNAQAMATLTKEIPILLTAVTDPADAKLVASNEAPGANITGTSDLTPIKEQIDLLKKLVPDAKKIAMLYTSSETNSLFQIGIAKKACDDLGIEYIDATISNANEIQQVLQSVISKVDAVYIPTDNTIASAMGTVAIITEPAKIPVITGAPAMAQEGGLASIGVDYYALGKLTALQAIAILKGEKEPATMPIEYLSDLKSYINEENAAKIGVTIPKE